MNSPSAPLAAFDFVLFGATGDLALRKLLPALFRQFVDGRLRGDNRILGVAREAQSAEDFRLTVQDALRRAVPDADEAHLDAFLGHVDYLALDATRDEGWEAFAAACHARDPRVRVFYLSVGPEIFAPLCARLARYKLNGPDSRLVVEKPLGRDLASAVTINDAIGAAFPERQIFRIDHYLGKETVQNLLALRFGNALFEPLWNTSHIEQVRITVAETLGVGSRGPYYDATGALRDMVQNHLLQLLCMIAMEPPSSLDPDAIRDEKLKVLRALKPIDFGNAGRLTVRGQYRGGLTADGMARGYLEDIGKPASGTETFVALKAELSNWRWAGVPFYLVTGKRLPEQLAEIEIRFRSIPHSIFADGGPIAANRLVLRLQPDEGIKLLLMSKYPDSDGLHLSPVSLDVDFAEAFRVRQLDAYERLLLDVVRGKLTLFMHRDEIEAAWRWIDPIVQAWSRASTGPLPYGAGSWGPAAAAAFVQRGGEPDGSLEGSPARLAGG
ncbi:MAG TPA: glucose-6-phosphate dehydrogenase [Gammaproteobacteria bacterium]|nr:glucose-6-phosphate dehydrogenase [Gammaproteobacteria bacterium]